MSCVLCGEGRPTERHYGLDFCGPCRVSDPTEALSDLGIASDWVVSMGRFHAGLGIAGQDPRFTLVCSPEALLDKLRKLVRSEVQVGDPVFDDRIFIQTNNTLRAANLLAVEGLQSALLFLLSDARPNELAGNRVALEGPTLTVGIRPLAGTDEDVVQQFTLATTAVALHLFLASRVS